MTSTKKTGPARVFFTFSLRCVKLPRGTRPAADRTRMSDPFRVDRLPLFFPMKRARRHRRETRTRTRGFVGCSQDVFAQYEALGRGVRRQTEADHDEHGEQDARNDDVHHVERVATTQVQRVLDVRVPRVRAARNHGLLTATCSGRQSRPDARDLLTLTSRCNSPVLARRVCCRCAILSLP